MASPTESSSASTAPTNFILRVRHAKGCLRLDLDEGIQTSVATIKRKLSSELDKCPTDQQKLTINGKTNDTYLQNKDTLQTLNLSHGAMIYLKVSKPRKSAKRALQSMIIPIQPNTSSAAEINDNLSSICQGPPSKKRKINTVPTTQPNPDARPRNPLFPPPQHTSSAAAASSSTATASSAAAASASSATPAALLPSFSKGKKKAKGGVRGGGRGSSPTVTATTTTTPTRGRKAKKKKKKKDESLVIRSEGDSAEAIAANYLNGNNVAMAMCLDEAAIAAQLELVANARLLAHNSGKVLINELLEESIFTSRAKSRGKRHLSIVFGAGAGHKKRHEQVCYFADDLMLEIVCEVIWKKMTKSRRASLFSNDSSVSDKSTRDKMIAKLYGSGGMVSLDEIAKRSPSFFWSLHHSFPSKNLTDVMQKFVSDAIGILRTRYNTDDSDAQK